MLTPQEKKKLMRLVYVSENNMAYEQAEKKRKEKKRREKKENKVLRVTNFQMFVSDYALPSACIA